LAVLRKSNSVYRFEGILRKIVEKEKKFGKKLVEREEFL